MRPFTTPFFKITFALVAYLLWPTISYATTTALASVSQTTVTQDEVFILKLAVNEKVSSDEVSFTELQDDFYTGRPNFGSSMSIVNGTRTQSSEWTITLAPLRLGELTIPSFNINGSKTQPITISVTQDKSAPTQQDMAEFELSLGTAKLYPNELTQLDVRLVIKADPRRLQNPRIDPPHSQGLTVEPIGESKQYQDVVQGQEVTVVQQTFNISAEKAGQYQLNGPKLTGAVVYSRGNSNRTKLFQLDTPIEEFEVTVLPIPADYAGTWLPTTSLKLNQTWTNSQGEVIDPNQPLGIEVGESLTRTISLTAKGLSQHQLPKLVMDYADTVRVYQEKPQFGQTESGDATVILQQVLIPKQSGTLELPAFSQTWFNTHQQVQETSHLNGLQLNVDKAEESLLAPTPAIAVNQQSDIIVQKNAGFWPYLSALLGALWLISSGIAIHYLRKYRTVAQVNATTTPLPIAAKGDLTEQLIDALKRNDGIQISAIYLQWKSKHTSSDQQALTDIDASIQHLIKDLYDGKGVPLDQQKNKALIERIKTLKAMRKQHQLTELAKL